jgi:thioesterase domain-containing protein/acyl carrier protein
VQRALVIVREDRPGDARLVAYVVSRSGVGAGALRTHLRRTLPEYMVPQHFVAMDAIPLLPNGKVNRHALPSPLESDRPERSFAVDVPNAAEQAVIAIWKDLLGVARVGLDDDFFELGGHSMLALRVIARMEKHFGRRLPVSLLMETPTVRSIVQSIEGERSSDSLVAIRSGSEARPLFLIHDGDGETLLYRGVAMALHEGLPVYGLRPSSKDGHPMLHTRIPEMVAHYVQRMREVQPHGPYFLGGLCAGGVLAFEAARQLEGAGEEVAFLALMDVADVAAPYRPGLVWSRRLASFTSSLPAEGSLVGRWRIGLTTAFGKLVGLLSYLRRSRADSVDVSRRIAALRERLDAGAPLDESFKSLTVRDIYMDARNQYEPPAEPLNARHVVLYRARQGRGDWADEPVINMHIDPLLGWGQRVREGNLTVVDVDGGHGSMLQDPHVRTLVTVMQEHLDRALGRRPAAGAHAP